MIRWCRQTSTHRSRPALALQQQQIRRQLGQSDAFTFFNILTGSELFDPLEALLPSHRERRFPPTETLAMFLRQALSEDRSCQRAVTTPSWLASPVAFLDAAHTLAPLPRAATPTHTTAHIAYAP
jgi:hypothetical protein